MQLELVSGIDTLRAFSFWVSKNDKEATGDGAYSVGFIFI